MNGRIRSAGFQFSQYWGGKNHKSGRLNRSPSSQWAINARIVSKSTASNDSNLAILRNCVAFTSTET